MTAQVFYLPDNKPIYVNIQDNIPDHCLYCIPPGNICSFELFMINLGNGLYSGCTIDVCVNSDMVILLEGLIKAM